jgi:hypothetical protein
MSNRRHEDINHYTAMIRNSSVLEGAQAKATASEVSFQFDMASSMIMD